MQDPNQKLKRPDINSGLEEELFYEYRHDRKSVDAGWKQIFEGNGHDVPALGPANGGRTATATAVEEPPVTPEPARPARPASVPMREVPQVQVAENDQVTTLRGPALKIAENMEASLTIPVATSQRVMPVKVIDENRRLINQYRELAGKTKVSYTHLVAWAIVRALEQVPALNQAYAERGTESLRITRGQVNLGLAIDVAGKDGSRSLKVPSVKNAQAMNFAQFLAAYDDLVARARSSKLTVPDFEGTTISLTNPGTVGTAGSIPRLMPGQGAIIATGAIDYPPEYRGMPEDARASLGLSKVMAITCTYDHRVIQGAESGVFLARLQTLLEGSGPEGDEFYTSIFAALAIPVRPFRWEPDQSASPVVNSDPMKQAGVSRLIEAWRERGHLAAAIDPLGVPRPSHPDLESATHGLTIWDLDRNFHAGPFGVATLRTLLDKLRSIYAGSIGVQYMHLDNPQERLWMQERIEGSHAHSSLDAAARKRVLRDIVLAQGFEEFLENRFKGHKRFSLEGGETSIAMIEDMLDRAASAGAEEAVIGMAHRGRLTLLANVVGKGVAQMFSEFEGDLDPESNDGSGDVKYHLGASNVRQMPCGKSITVSVAANPSHLEAVNPVVEGIVRPKQDRLGDVRRERVIPVLIHGDAAMSGQGIVAEVFNFSQIDGYNTGGTVHLVINNQIGFTTGPHASRSSTYCTDPALAIGAPVLHVNGDDPEASIRAMRLALDYRRAFHKDAVVDMVCYRKHGHNEGDDPSYTQPLMYRLLEHHKPAGASYAARLIADGVVTQPEVAGWQEAQKKELYEIYDQTQKVKQEYELLELTPLPMTGMPTDLPPTAVDRDVIHAILDGIATFPQTFHLHPKLQRVVDRRKEAHSGPHIDWALAETLAFGSLVLEGTPVRLSGQDSGRGTFSQRHAEFHDYQTGEVYAPLQHLSPAQARFDVYNSPLSEYGVLGFEFGYSIADPLSLVLWEAQYGDFANGAQIIIDQFISTAESKWGQPSGLVMLLPHGQEGGGPEHSSARLERFLQLCAESNMQVVCATTPAQYFHLLRRQMRGGEPPSGSQRNTRQPMDRRGLRKPLVVMTPKSLLRHPKVVSTVDELASGAFLTVLDDPSVADPSTIKRILLCTGKVYYELAAARDARGALDTAVVRIEQLYPFPQQEIATMLARYKSAQAVVWVQEEPRNMGAWAFLRGHLRPMLGPELGVGTVGTAGLNMPLGYAGRPRNASPAPGLLKRHQREQADLLAQAFGPPTVARSQRKRLVTRRKALRP